ncbi:unnamed protein product, partial [marine sediment metagenome]
VTIMSHSPRRRLYETEASAGLTSFLRYWVMNRSGSTRRRRRDV